MRQLLIKQSAQARQLVRIAQTRRIDDLVALGGEGAIGKRILVGAALTRHLPRPAGTARIVVARARHQFALDLFGAGGFAVLLLFVGRAAFDGALRVRAGALALVAVAIAVVGF